MDPCNDVSITNEVTHDGIGENSQLEEDTDSASVSLRLQLKKSLNIVLDLQKATISMIQSIAWLKVNHPEEDSIHFLSLSEYFPDVVTLDELSVLEHCSPMFISTHCVYVLSTFPYITSTPKQLQVP